jgi:hypothetical protein
MRSNRNGPLSSGDDYDRIITEKQNVSDCTEHPTNDGRIEIIDVLGLSSDYAISWSGPGVNGSTSPIIENLGLGDYTVTITTRDGCTMNKIITICCCGSEKESGKTKNKCSNQDNIFPIALYQNLLLSPADENSYDGEISVNIHGGTPDNQISWSGPNGYTSSRPHIRNLGIGEYCITVSDGCSKASRCFELISCASRNISISGNETNTCQGLSFGSINIQVSGGDPPYRYSWSNGSSSSTLSNLPRGTYRVTVSDANGCNTSASYFVDDSEMVEETSGSQFSLLIG